MEILSTLCKTTQDDVTEVGTDILSIISGSAEIKNHNSSYIFDWVMSLNNIYM